MANVNISISGQEILPGKKYIFEVKEGSLSHEAFDSLAEYFQRVGAEGLLLITENGESINMKEIPEEKLCTN